MTTDPLDLALQITFAGAYRMGDVVYFWLKVKPRWWNRLGVRVVLGWEWTDA